MSSDGDLIVRLMEALAIANQVHNVRMMERDEARMERDEALRERDEARPVVPEDTRPLIDGGAWREAHPDEWDRLWLRPETCPVCMEVPEPDQWNGPVTFALIGFAVRCTHWACSQCWEQIARRDRRCPICRDDLSAWFPRTPGSGSSSG